MNERHFNIQSLYKDILEREADLEGLYNYHDSNYDISEIKDYCYFSIIASFNSSIFIDALCCKYQFTKAIPMSTPINTFSPFFILIV